jgi:hypothetical protein
MAALNQDVPEVCGQQDCQVHCSSLHLACLLCTVSPDARTAKLKQNSLRSVHGELSSSNQQCCLVTNSVVAEQQILYRDNKVHHSAVCLEPLNSQIAPQNIM